MACLGSVSYDPAGAIVTKATTSPLAMTALDTTNLRLTFTPPASGRVLVRLAGQVKGATTVPSMYLGVMSGATVVGKRLATAGGGNITASSVIPFEAVFVVSGLAGSQTWDAAYGVEVAVASSNLVYGGPNNAIAGDAAGPFNFEVWDA